jgi:hypothetical protein
MGKTVGAKSRLGAGFPKKVVESGKYAGKNSVSIPANIV